MEIQDDETVLKIAKTIEKDWKSFASKVGTDVQVVGISGGIDSSVIAALAARIFGKDKVYGVMMPNGYQRDLSDSKQLVEFLGIHGLEVNVGRAYGDIKAGIENALGTIAFTRQAGINLAPRLRMATLFAVAQNVNGTAICSDNLSEIVTGYSTFGGDNFGSYAPLKNLVKTEVFKLAKLLGLPKNLAEKAPADGLSGMTDEDKLGFSYEELDCLIRFGIGTDEFTKKIRKLWQANKFKTDIVNVPAPEFGFLKNFFSSDSSS